jgi:hypothetical protein
MWILLKPYGATPSPAPREKVPFALAKGG